MEGTVEHSFTGFLQQNESQVLGSTEKVHFLLLCVCAEIVQRNMAVVARVVALHITSKTNETFFLSLCLFFCM